MSKYVVGLTGGIGSGKTTVANLFEKLGVTLVDADVIAREVVAVGSDGLKQIAAHFGKNILTQDGSLDRAQLRARVFNAPSELEWLNQLLHPLIRINMQKEVESANSAYVLMVVPLLFENGLDSLVNRTLVVDISPDSQVKRVTKRDNTEHQVIDNIIANQISREDRLAKADDVIDNQGQISELERKVRALHDKYLLLSAE